MTGELIGQLILWLIVTVIAVAIIYWVMQWLYRRSTKEVAFELGRSASTVYTHAERIRKKLGVDTAAELVRYAERWRFDG